MTVRDPFDHRLQHASDPGPGGPARSSVIDLDSTSPSTGRTVGNGSAVPPAVTAGGPSPQLRLDVDDSDAHLLRLCLDLQLDAMLLTLGAAAAGAARGEDPGPDGDGGQAPWRRWVSEDVDLARTLATDALAGRAALPPTLGSDLHHAVPATTIDNLAARYESMRALLADLADRGERMPAAAGRGGADAAAESRRPRVREALDQCDRRLAELREYRLLTTPPRGIRLTEEHQYLPGELLG